MNDAPRPRRERLKEVAYGIFMSILFVGGMIAITWLYSYPIDWALSFIPAGAIEPKNTAIILATMPAGVTVVAAMTLLLQWMDRQ